MSNTTDTTHADRTLLAAVAEGDMQAFQALHRRHNARIYGFAFRIVQASDRAEEIANDTWLAVWKGASKFEGRSKVSTWLFGIAYRTALKTRRRFRFEIGHVELDHDLRASDDTNAENALISRDVTRALARLSIEHRTIMELTYYYGLTYTEIGELIGCPEGTVKSRMSQARKKMKSLLEPTE
ncbi:MAG: sigma-70 family RNA polymerase sigma factor [Pseudomonadota bacterium]